jgi:DNA-binding MarR family transcriptional regulator
MVANTKRPASTPVRKSAARRTILDRVKAVDVGVREMAVQTMVSSQIVAAHFGLHTTDLRVLDIVFMRGRLTAGDLAKATGLSSGSVTALVDRLIAAGLVERRDDPTDRRKVWIQSRKDAIEPIAMIFMPSQQRMFALWRTFTADQLATIEDFLSRTTALAAACAEDIRRQTKASGRPRRPTTSKETTS